MMLNRLDTRSQLEGNLRPGLAGDKGWNCWPARAEDTGRNSSGPAGGREESLAHESRGPVPSHAGGSLLEQAHWRRKMREKKK
ncbi:hypothetical protein TIFTF001_034225 [Ficus carica]|uniref:Uncharacterized protein n=1 Tax=Ficus carica TaxID=3494 RepID=A0AA88DZF4_FICCA|nr:hypothetical protein TIFTF001_034225 [Ficus carica]